MAAAAGSRSHARGINTCASPVLTPCETRQMADVLSILNVAGHIMPSSMKKSTVHILVRPRGTR